MFIPYLTLVSVNALMLQIKYKDVSLRELFGTNKTLPNVMATRMAVYLVLSLSYWGYRHFIDWV